MRPTSVQTLQSIIENERASKLRDLVRIAQKSLPCRAIRSIESLFVDIGEGTYHNEPTIAAIRPKRKNLTTTRLGREMGQSCQSLKSKIYTKFLPTRTFKNMSGDVDWITFSHDGTHFAVSATNTTDSYNQDYNNPMNLVISTAATDSILELADHWTPRQKLPPKPLKAVDMISEESKLAAHIRNEIEAENKFKTQDPRLFHTVPMTAFSPDNRFLYSVGFDATMNVYDLHNSYSRSYYTFSSRLSLLDVNSYNGLIAVGCASSASGISIFTQNSEGTQLRTVVSSEKARARPDLNIYPSCLKWGNNQFTRTFLLAGFSANEKEDAGAGRDTKGEICLYRVRSDGQYSSVPLHAHSGSIMDVCWNRNGRSFAVGMINPSNKPISNRSANSVIRIYDLNGFKKLEFDCVARDINDVVICPYDDNYVAVGATDSRVYIYDCRMPDREVVIFKHGSPLAVNQDVERDREDWDSGVRFLNWGRSKDMLVTGSSDGAVKQWNILRNDTNGSDIIHLNSGITSGAFSPDYTKLAVGEINRSFTMLEIGQQKCTALRSLQQLKVIHDSFDSLKSLKAAPLQSEVQSSYTGDMTVNFTDSKRSHDRLPTSLMAALTINDDEQSDKASKKHTSGKLVSLARLICAHCGKPARSGDDQVGFPLCERCGFACFSCGDRLKVNPKLDFIKCRKCEKEWTIGALGYHLKGAGEMQAQTPPVYDLNLEGAEVTGSMDDCSNEDAMDMLYQLWEVQVKEEPKKDISYF
jgi:WD40 repeat protein